MEEGIATKSIKQPPGLSVAKKLSWRFDAKQAGVL